MPTASTLFSPNARLYLASVVILGAAIGVYRLLFNFYVLSLGYDQALLGTLVTTSSLTALIAAMPLGYLIDIIGQKRALIFWRFSHGNSHHIHGAFSRQPGCSWP